MNIVVLVKQVPAISDIEIAKDNNLVRVGAPSMLNPVDKHAIEAAGGQGSRWRYGHAPDHGQRPGRGNDA